MPEAIYPTTTLYNLELLLQEVNDTEVLSLYPLLFFYAAILIVGVLGNALVLLVYSFRYHRSPARVYILFLAAIDFSMCLFGLPYHLIDMTHPYTYTNSSACKALTFIITTLFHMSIFGLIVIAIDRYLKICKPLGKIQIAYFGKKRACGAAVLAAIIMSWPNLVLYGPSEMESPDGNITGHACFFETAYLQTNYPFVYTLLTLCICIGSTIFLIISYSLIVHKICTRYTANNFKITGKCMFDDTTLTEELCFKNDTFPSAGLHNRLIETTFSKSSEDLRQCGKYNSTETDIVRCKSESGNLNSLDERLVVCNSNGSLTFVGKSANTINSENAEDVKVPLLDCNGKGISNRDIHLTNRNSKGESPNGSYGYLNSNHYKKINNSQKSINHTKEKHHRTNVGSRSLMSLHRKQMHSTSSLAGGYTGSPMNGLHRDARYSLQVPGALLPHGKKLTFRRASDLTGNKSNDIIEQWKQCSSLALRNFKHGHDFHVEGLRIHSSCQSVNISTHGVVKSKTIVTKQHTKITKIMLTISIIFVLSYSPALLITIWTAVQPEFWDILDKKETIICEFFLRFYMVNNICNPFIYGFWDKRFKREIAYTFKKISMSLKSKCKCCMKMEARTK